MSIILQPTILQPHSQGLSLSGNKVEFSQNKSKEDQLHLSSGDKRIRSTKP